MRIQSYDIIKNKTYGRPTIVWFMEPIKRILGIVNTSPTSTGNLLTIRTSSCRGGARERRGERFFVSAYNQQRSGRAMTSIKRRERTHATQHAPKQLCTDSPQAQPPRTTRCQHPTPRAPRRTVQKEERAREGGRKFVRRKEEADTRLTGSHASGETRARAIASSARGTRTARNAPQPATLPLPSTALPLHTTTAPSFAERQLSFARFVAFF